jgi:hypothetical protein
MANFLVNRRMNKAQRMRWSRRAAVFNGKLGSRLGQLFHAEADPIPDLAMDAYPPTARRSRWYETLHNLGSQRLRRRCPG